MKWATKLNLIAEQTKTGAIRFRIIDTAQAFLFPDGHKVYRDLEPKDSDRFEMIIRRVKP